MEKKNEQEEKYCGNCCWFYGEMTDGEGFCAAIPAWSDMFEHRCENSACAKYVSRQEMRHHMAVLLQHRRCMHDCNVRAIRKPVDAIELGKAEDFAYKYMKNFSKL